MHSTSQHGTIWLCWKRTPTMGGETRSSAQNCVHAVYKRALNPIRHQGSKPAPILRFSLSAALIILVWKFAGDRLCYCSANCGSSQSTGKVDRARVFCGRHPPLHLVCQTVQAEGECLQGLWGGEGCPLDYCSLVLKSVTRQPASLVRIQNLYCLCTWT